MPTPEIGLFEEPINPAMYPATDASTLTNAFKDILGDILRDSQEQVASLATRVRELETALADERLNRPGRRVFAAGTEGDVISLRAGTRSRKQNQLEIWRPPYDD